MMALLEIGILAITILAIGNLAIVVLAIDLLYALAVDRHGVVRLLVRPLKEAEQCCMHLLRWRLPLMFIVDLVEELLEGVVVRLLLLRQRRWGWWWRSWGWWWWGWRRWWCWWWMWGWR
jgi:hypothetical protein